MIFGIILMQQTEYIPGMIMEDIANGLKQSRVPFCWAFHTTLRQYAKAWTENNRGLVDGVIVISESRNETRIMEEVADLPNVHVWTFDGLKNPAINDECFRYFPDVYPKEMKEKDGIKRIIGAIGAMYLGKEFFQQLEEILTA